MDSILNQKINEKFDDFIVNIINYFSNQNIVEINNKNNIILSLSTEDDLHIKKKSVLSTIQQILIHMDIIKPSYKLTRDDLIGIIVLIETKLSMESIILYMGYFFDNSDSCETNDKNDEQLLSQLNNLIINRFYSNDFEFFKTILINQYFINKQKFSLHFSMDQLDYELSTVFSTIESMFRQKIFIPIKKDTEVRIMNDTLLNDGINRYDVYKVKSISVDNLIDYNKKYNRLNDDLTDVENKQLQNYYYFLKEDKPCSDSNLEKLLYSKKKKGGNLTSKKKLKKVNRASLMLKLKKRTGGASSSTCPPEFEEIPDYFTLKHDIDKGNYTPKAGFRNGWNTHSVPVPDELLKMQKEKEEKPKSWSESLKQSIIGIVEDKYTDRIYFSNKNLCRKTSDFPPSNPDVDIDEEEEETYFTNPTTRNEAIQGDNTANYFVYKLYKDQSIYAATVASTASAKEKADEVVMQALRGETDILLATAEKAAAEAAVMAMKAQTALNEVVECNNKLDKIWYYENDLVPVKIPINPENNLSEGTRTIFRYPLKDVNNDIILDNKEIISDDFIHSGIPILWFYKIFCERWRTDKDTTAFKNVDEVFSKNMEKLLINLKRYILFNNRFNEETLGLFIILGSIMYTTTNITKDDVFNDTPYDLFDREFMFNDIIKDMIKNNNSKYLDFLNDKIPYILSSNQFLEYLDYKTNDTTDLGNNQLLAIIILISMLGVSTMKTMISIGTFFQNIYNNLNFVNYIEQQIEEQKVLTEKSNYYKGKLYFSDTNVSDLVGVTRVIEPKEYEQLTTRLNLVETQLNQITYNLEYQVSKLLARKFELTEQTAVSRYVRDYVFSNQEQQVFVNDSTPIDKIDNELSEINSLIEKIVPKEVNLYKGIQTEGDVQSFLTNAEVYLGMRGTVSKLNNNDFSLVIDNNETISITPKSNNSDIVRLVVQKSLSILKQSTKFQSLMQQPGDKRFQLFVYMHGFEKPVPIQILSNLTHFNYIVVETQGSVILDLNQQHGSIGTSYYKDDLETVKGHLRNRTDSNGIKGLTAVPFIAYALPDGFNSSNVQEIDKHDGIYLTVQDSLGRESTVQLVNNTHIQDVLKSIDPQGDRQYITSPEMVEILRGVRSALNIEPQNIHLAIHSCQGFADTTLYQKIDEIKPIELNSNNSQTFIPFQILSKFEDTVHQNISVLDLSRTEYKPGQLLKVKHKVIVNDKNMVVYAMVDTNYEQIASVKMPFGILKNFFYNEVQPRKHIWDKMTPIQQYSAMMAYKQNKGVVLTDADHNNAPPEIKTKITSNWKQFNSADYLPGNWDSLTSGKSKYSNSNADNSNFKTDSFKKKFGGLSRRIKKGGYPFLNLFSKSEPEPFEKNITLLFNDYPGLPSITSSEELEKLYDYFDSKLPVLNFKLTFSDNICDKYYFIFLKLINQLILLQKKEKGIEYTLSDIRIFYEYINFNIILAEEKLTEYRKDKSKEIEMLDKKIKNKWNKLKENGNNYYTYDFNIIKLFKKYQSGDKIELNEYEDIIKYTWAKYIFLNDLSLTDNKEDLLKQINAIDRTQGEPLIYTPKMNETYDSIKPDIFIDPLKPKPYPENSDSFDKTMVMEEPTISYKIIYSNSLSNKLPNYEEHIKDNGMKYINDIELNYNNYTVFKELYLKYFQDIEIQLKKISSVMPISKIKDIKNLINEDMLKITNEINRYIIGYKQNFVNQYMFDDEEIRGSSEKYNLEYLEEDGLIDFNIKYNLLNMIQLNQILFDDLIDYN